MTTVYFVRHGQSTTNLSHCFAGFTDVPLTELGYKQALRTAEFLADKPISAVYSSDLSRAYNTACAVAEKHSLTVQKNAELREIFAGAWEGRNYDDLEVNDVAYQLWIRQIGLAVCTDGESVAHLQERIAKAVSDIVANHPNESICIVAHGTPIRVLSALYSGVSLANLHTVPWVSNASVTIAEFHSTQNARIVAAGLHEHLEDLVSVLPTNI